MAQPLSSCFFCCTARTHIIHASPATYKRLEACDPCERADAKLYNASIFIDFTGFFAPFSPPRYPNSLSSILSMVPAPVQPCVRIYRTSPKKKLIFDRNYTPRTQILMFLKYLKMLKFSIFIDFFPKIGLCPPGVQSLGLGRGSLQSLGQSLGLGRGAPR